MNPAEPQPLDARNLDSEHSASGIPTDLLQDAFPFLTFSKMRANEDGKAQCVSPGVGARLLHYHQRLSRGDEHSPVLQRRLL